jgi:hypothetical protein
MVGERGLLCEMDSMTTFDSARYYDGVGQAIKETKHFP